MAGSRPTIGQVELQILGHIADQHPASVREVAMHVASTTGQARTTVLTVMERLRQKGYLKRKKVGGVYRYWPTVAKAQLLQTLVGDFVENMLGGSVSPFVAYLMQSHRLTNAQLRELRRLAHALQEEAQEGT